RAGQPARLGPLLEQRDAVGIRHPDIQQDQVRTPRTAGALGALRVFRDAHFITLVLKDLAHEVADLRFVVHNQDVVSRHMLLPLPMLRCTASKTAGFSPPAARRAPCPYPPRIWPRPHGHRRPPAAATEW